MQKPFRRRNNADLIPRLRAWTELKKQSIEHSSTWDSSGHGIRPRPCQHRWVALGHGGCCIPAVVACMVMGVVWYRFGEIQAESFPGRILSWKCTEMLRTTLQTEIQQHREWLHRTSTHLMWESQNQHPTGPARELRSTWGSPEIWGFLRALAKLTPLVKPTRPWEDSDDATTWNHHPHRRQLSPDQPCWPRQEAKQEALPQAALTVLTGF